MFRYENECSKVGAAEIKAEINKTKTENRKYKKLYKT
jgi:hypothetical protein